MAKKVTAAPEGSIEPAQAGRHASGRSRYRTGLVIAATAAVAGLTVTTATTASAVGVGTPSPSARAATTAATTAPQRVGAVPRVPAGSVRTGTPSGSTAVTLSIGLEPRNPGELQQYVDAVSTKGSPEFHHYLAKGQFASVFGPAQSSIDNVESALRKAGLKPGEVSADGLSIAVNTTLAAAGSAFHTSFTSYRLADHRNAYANTAAPLLSGAVAADVSGVTGLDTLSQRVSFHTAPQAHGTRPALGARASLQRTRSVTADATGGPQICNDAVTALGGNGLGTDGDGYYSAANLAGTYNMEHNATSGSGVTIGVIEFERYAPSDLAAYQACYGTHVPVSTVSVDGGGKAAPSSQTGVGQEATLDLDDLVSLAPGASIIDYEGPDLNSAFTDADWLNTYQEMVTDDRAQVLSMSWGGCQLNTDPSVITAENYYSEEAAAQGQTIFAASGDNGAVDCYGNPTNANTDSVNDPASQPFVTGVGGTTLSGDPVYSRAVWNTGTALSGIGASGGGVSVEAPLTNGGSNFQKGFTGQGYSASACHATSAGACRQVPDVSALADPFEGYPVYLWGSWQTMGGTSGATPTWAALTAIADSEGACKANGPLGYLNFDLYKAAGTSYQNDFTDITSGNNVLYGDRGYNSTTGYDLTTGLGEPNAANLTATLCGNLPTAATGVSTYHPVNATVVLNTRPSTVPSNAVTGVQIEGNSAIPGMPSSGVTSVVLNVTVTKTNGSGYLTAWGDDTHRPGTSNLDWQAGQTLSNLVTVPVPADGRVDFFVSGSAAAVIATIQGYYSNDANGLTYTGVTTPARILDTRYANGISTRTPVSGIITLKVIGRGGVPAGAKVAAVNLIVTNTTGAGYLAAYPQGSPTANVTDLTWTAKGATQSGLAFVPIGADGSIRLLVYGKTNVIADVDGYFTQGTGGASFTSTTPTRFLSAPITGGKIYALQVTGRGGVPAGAKYVVMNVTVSGSSQVGYLLTWADQTRIPGVTTLIWGPRTAIPNEVVAPIGADGKVDLFVSSTSEVFADVSGYLM